jgi:hypothetical protein
VLASCCISSACEARKKKLRSRFRFDGVGLFPQAFFLGSCRVSLLL